MNQIHLVIERSDGHLNPKTLMSREDSTTSNAGEVKTKTVKAIFGKVRENRDKFFFKGGKVSYTSRMITLGFWQTKSPVKLVKSILKCIII